MPPRNRSSWDERSRELRSALAAFVNKVRDWNYRNVTSEALELNQRRRMASPSLRERCRPCAGERPAPAAASFPLTRIVRTQALVASFVLLPDVAEALRVASAVELDELIEINDWLRRKTHCAHRGWRARLTRVSDLLPALYATALIWLRVLEKHRGGKSG